MELHKRYMREDIPALVGDTFNRGKWLVGHVATPAAVVLLVTLKKDDMKHNYADRFSGKQVFEWQSQNATKLNSAKGQQIADGDLPIRLFVRKSKKVKGKAAPFVYCGTVEANAIVGEAPMNVQFLLSDPITDDLLQEFRV